MFRWLKPIRLSAVCAALLLTVTACSPERELIELKESDVTFATEPTPPKAGAPSRFHLAVAGLQTPEDVDVSFELKPKGEERGALYAAMQYEPGKYEASVTFKQPGDYELTLHVQTLEVHHSFVRDLTVSP